MVRGNKCAFFNCGKSRKDNPDMRQFRFPKNESLSRQWVINSGNVKLLGLSPESLYKQVACSNHFEECDFANRNVKGNLKKGAVPKSYETNPIPAYLHPSTSSATSSLGTDDSPTSKLEKLPFTIPSKTYARSTEIQKSISPSTSSPKTSSIRIETSPASKKWLVDISEMPESPPKKCERKLNLDEDTPRKRKLKLTIQNQKRLLKNKRSTIARLKCTIKKKSQDATLANIIGNVKFASKNSQVLTTMQILHTKNKQWTKNEKEFSLQLFYRSPSAYKFLRNRQHIILPSIATIRKWIGDSKFKPGFSPNLLNNLKIKVNSMDEQAKECTLIFDEMKIKSKLEYSKLLDVIEGYEDLGPLGRKPIYGSQVMVFMLRGLYSSWKMPLAYFVCATSMKHSSLKALLITAIEKMVSAGLKVRAIICDQGTNNQAALKNLGITEENPFFFVKNSKILAIFDVPHLYKNFRNHWLANDFLFEGKRVSFDIIRKCYEIDQQSSTGRSLMKITPVHLNPNPFQKMNCALALQIFSRSVAASVRTAASTGELNSQTAMDSADFIEFMNNLFDTLNSKQLFTKKPYNCAISDKNPLIKETLQEALQKLTNCVKLTPRGPEAPPCFHGMVHSINAILSLYNEQFERGYPYLLTNRVNQDVIENSFSTYRQRGGYNPNPTVRTFRCTFRLCAKINLMKPSELSNCESDMDYNLFQMNENTSVASEFGQQLLVTGTLEKSESDTSLSSHSSSSLSSVGSKKGPTLEDCSNVYFSGYIAKCLLDKFKCDYCKNNILKDGDLNEKKQMLIIQKSYNVSQLPVGLRRPSDNLVEVVEKSLKIIKKILDKSPHMRNLTQKIAKKIFKNAKVSKLITNESCQLHIEFLVKKIINTKIFKECQWRSLIQKPKPSKSIQNKKLNILKSL